MKKIIYFLLIFIFFFPHNNSLAFNRYPQNPILIPTEEYDRNGLLAPTLVYKNNQYYMWYTSIQTDNIMSISFATSTDGINWVKSITNPVIRPNNNNPFICEKNVHDPEVIWNESLNLFQMWYVASCEPKPTGEARYWIKYAQSNDGINWELETKPVLYPFLDWEKEGISSPTILLEGSEYKMWYSGRNSSGKWQIGYATSFDGKNWNKHLNNPIISPTKPWEITHIAGNDIFKENNLYFLYYYGAHIWPPINIVFATSLDGLNWEKPENNPILTINSMEVKITGPDIIKDTYEKKIYYSAMINNIWQISLLTEKYNTPTLTSTPTPTTIPTSTPILNLTPTITNTPTLTPTPTMTVIVVLPGLMASWNKKAILYNEEVSFNQWKIPTFIKEYEGLVQSLINHGFEKEKNLFIFPYDWRKPVNSTVKVLNQYLKEKIWNDKPNQKINIIGHSLGGLIGRIFTQEYKDKVDKIIAVGSPHLGAVQVYKPLEAGEIDQENTFLWLAQKIILVLNKDSIETDRQTFQKRFPVGFDLFPVFDFLKDEKNIIISVDSLSIKNQLLSEYNQTLFQINPSFYVIYGEKEEKTPAGFTVENPSVIDKLLGNFKDGKPKSVWYDSGDLTVLSKSAKQGINTQSLPLDHGEIITKKNAIEKIFTILFSIFHKNLIVEGEKTVITPSLIFMIKSPATISVEFNKQIFNEEEGIIFIPNAQSGQYLLKAKGLERGKYTIYVGQIAEKNDIWEKIDGEIIKTPPESQIDQYIINFNNKNAQLTFVTPSPSQNLSNNSSVNSNNQNIKQDNTSYESKKTLKNDTYKKNLASSLNKESDNNTKKNVLGVKNNSKNYKSENTKFKKNNFWIKILIIIIFGGVIIIYLKFFSKKENKSKLDKFVLKLKDDFKKVINFLMNLKFNKKS